MTDSPAQRDWITRSLGFEFPSGPRTEHGPALPVWQAAKDAVDAQLRQLSDRLRKTSLPVLVEVADELEHLLEPFRVGLVAALLAFDRAPVEVKPAARAAAIKALTAALVRLDAEKRLPAVDANGFGVSVSVRATLGAALRRLQHQLAAG